jgi:nitrite reductase/ring-hydroxylating ferredoxin subunit
MSQTGSAGTALASLVDITDGGTKGFTLGEGDWPLRGLLVRLGDVVHGYLNRCPHAGHRLNFMPDRFLTPDGTLILCQSHGALFDKATGECVAGPCPGEALTRLPIEVRDGRVTLAADIDIDALAQRPW